jgi:hypothetical protein
MNIFEKVQAVYIHTRSELNGAFRNAYGIIMRKNLNDEKGVKLEKCHGKNEEIEETPSWLSTSYIYNSLFVFLLYLFVR